MARGALGPVKAFVLRPQAICETPASSQLMAWTLFAEALATPERAGALLAEAARRMDALPVEMRALRSTSRLREEIAREAAARR